MAAGKRGGLGEQLTVSIQRLLAYPFRFSYNVQRAHHLLLVSGRGYRGNRLRLNTSDPPAAAWSSWGAGTLTSSVGARGGEDPGCLLSNL
jgi:hypothetical protein